MSFLNAKPTEERAKLAQPYHDMIILSVIAVSGPKLAFINHSLVCVSAQGVLLDTVYMSP